MQKIGSLITLICILNLLALGGLAGYLLGTGRLNKAKAQVITDLLRTQNSPDDLRGKVYDIVYPVTATQPATSTAPATGPVLVRDDIPATAAERNEYVRRAVEQERLRLENEAQDLRNRQESLALSQSMLDARYKQFTAEKKAFDEQAASVGKQKDDTSFQKMLSYFSELKPKQIKELLVTMTPEDASRYVSAMEPEQVAKLMAEFKSTDEKDKLKAIMDRIRGVTPSVGTGAASETGAGLTAAAPTAKVGS